MKPMLRVIVGCLAVGMLVLAGGRVQAQTTANGPYYATPSWDQTLQCDTPATCPRFIVLSNMAGAAVLDRETGLVWQRSHSTELITWAGALQRCTDATVGNRLGWRLATVEELTSLVDPTVTVGPMLPAGHPFNMENSTFYWSATTIAGATSNAYAVSFNTSSSKRPWAVPKNSPSYFTWCVRGGQGADSH